MNKEKVAIVGAGPAGVTLAWLCSSAGLQTHIFERESDYTSANIELCSYFFPAYHSTLAALYDYLGLYTEPRSLDYVYDYIPKFETSGTLFRDLHFKEFSLFAKRQLNSDFKKLIQHTKISAANPPKNITLKQVLRGLMLSPRSRQYALPAILGTLWQYPQDSASGLPAEKCLEFLRSLLSSPIIRCLYEGAQAYTSRLIFKGDWEFFPSCPIKQIRRMEDGIFIQREDGEEQRYDKVILTCNLKEMLRICPTLSNEERTIFEKMRYSHIPAWIHSDEDVFSPSIKQAINRKKYAFYITHYSIRQELHFAYHYDMHLLQNMPPNHWLSLNLSAAPAKETILWQGTRRCPSSDIATLQSIRLLDKVQGNEGLWHAGDYTVYQTSSFNANILTALKLAKKLGLDIPFNVKTP